MNDLTLLILAAGMGSRFGGLKQIEPVGPNNEFIIDYSIYDAIKAGFTKVVFIIKEENYDIFRETIGKRIEEKIKVEYVFQKNELPKPFEFPKTRTKPFGTAHAILSAKSKINEPFVVINSDDFYGREAYYTISNYLKSSKDTYALVGYKVKNTLTQYGAVKRGICKLNGEYLSDLIESNIIKENNEIIATPLNGTKSFKIEDDTLVSMNMLGFLPNIFDYLEEYLIKFLQTTKELETCEYLIPDVLSKIEIKTKVLTTNARWIGVTYKEDKEQVVESLKELIKNKEYPNNLWKKN